MTRFLFWNLNRKPIAERVARLAAAYAVDVILLAESTIQPAALLGRFNNVNFPLHFAPSVNNIKIQIFTRFLDRYLHWVYDDERLTIRHLVLPGTDSILLAAVHFPDKRNWSEDSQAAESSRLAADILDVEDRIGHRRTLLIGDLNMNPFEAGMVNAVGLHAISSKAVAAGGSRIVRGRAYPYFYNPMWSLLGDNSPGPPGTYYLRRAEHKVFFWNTFDQVLVRPDLINRLDIASLKVLDHDGTDPLVNSRGIPDATAASDHLPIIFDLNT